MQQKGICARYEKLGYMYAGDGAVCGSLSVGTQCQPDEKAGAADSLENARIGVDTGEGVGRSCAVE